METKADENGGGEVETEDGEEEEKIENYWKLAVMPNDLGSNNVQAELVVRYWMFSVYIITAYILN